MVICTISTASHLPKAACLARSLRDSQPEHTMLLCLVEKDKTSIAELGEYFQRIVLASELGMVGFESMLFPYAASEACMAMKAQMLLWAMEDFASEDYFLYLDSDIFAYSRFEELEFALPRSEILLTPHHVQDEYSHETTCDNMFRTLLCGVFNAGFVAVRRSPMAISFLQWWNKKLNRFCYKDESRGLYFDQKWLDAAIPLFDIKVFREPGYNVANWNLVSRDLTTSPARAYLVNGRPLRFFHFSMLDVGRDLFYFRHHVREDNPILRLREEYIKQVESMDASAHSQIQWSYDLYRSGERVDPEVRLAWRRLPEMRTKFSDPFAESNVDLCSVKAFQR